MGKVPPVNQVNVSWSGKQSVLLHTLLTQAIKSPHLNESKVFHVCASVSGCVRVESSTQFE
jgi:hypothetical protein